MNLSEAVAKGRREGLVALRDVLAASVGLADPDRRAPLAKQLSEVMRELDSLPNAEVVSRVDELKAKRAKRRPAAKDSASAAGDGKRRPGRGRAGGVGGPAS
jgi:hypothetical protein